MSGSLHFGLVKCGTLAHLGDPPDADYWWTWPGAADVALCAGCCANWRYSSERGGPVPERIRSVERPQVFMAPVGSDPDDPGAWTPLGEIAGELKWDWS